MLKKLYIKNYALVDEIEIDFKPGLTVLTGETGAGKSVIIGGLRLALGGRADKDLIRHGTKKSTAHAVFNSDSKSFKKIKADSEIAFSREVSTTGSSRAYINETITNLNTIHETVNNLCELHSQQDQRGLLEQERHLFFIDSYAGLNTKVEKLLQLFDSYISLEKRLKNTQENAQAVREKLELINFQIDELTESNLRIGEETELEIEKKRLESVQTLLETAQTLIDSLSENDNSIISVLSRLESRLNDAAGIDERLSEEAKLLSESRINLNELTRNIESYFSRLDDNPQRLDDINARLAELYRLKKKYKTDEAGLIDLLSNLRDQSLSSTDIQSLIAELKDKLAEARREYYELALEISKKRRKAATTFEKKIIKQLNDLAIEDAQLKIDFTSEGDESGFEVNGKMLKANNCGFETAEFLISTNPKEPLRPLSKIASGGEISRIMLAILTVIAGKYKLPTIVFDEIDTGIGGQTANKLAEKLKELSKNHQVITISHLPPVASRADNHLAVSKKTVQGRNIIDVKSLTPAEIKKEIKRMRGA
ncbi:MAG: DNA repair protein RecN [candidate division Zixibacteria bacterium]